MANELKIKIGADISGINQVDAGLKKLAQTGKSFNAASNQVTAGFKGVATSSNAANVALINTGRVLQDLPFGIIGIANNINPLLESFQRLKAESGSTKVALSSLGASLIGGGGLGLAVSAVTAIATFATIGFQAFSRGIGESKQKTDELKSSLDGVVKNIASEATNVTSLVAVLTSETETRERKLAAIKQLNQIQPEVFKNLNLEGTAVVGLDDAYKKYLANLQTVLAVKLKQAQLEQQITKLLELQGGTLTANEKKVADIINNINEQQKNKAKAIGGTEGAQFLDLINAPQKKINKEIDDVRSNIAQLQNDIIELSKGINIKIDLTPPKDPANKLKDTVSLTELLARNLKDANREAGELFTKTPPLIKDTALNFGDTGIGPKRDNAKYIPEFIATKYVDPLQQKAQKAADIFNNTLGPAIQNAFNAAITGSKSFGQAFGDALKGIVVQLAATLIKTAALAAVLSAITGGAGFKLGGQNLTGFGNIFKGLLGKGFAGGGVATGPQSGYLALLHGTEAIFNQDQLRALNKVIGSARQSFDFPDLIPVMRGEDIYLANNKVANRYLRNR